MLGAGWASRPSRGGARTRPGEVEARLRRSDADRWESEACLQSAGCPKLLPSIRLAPFLTFYFRAFLSLGCARDERRSRLGCLGELEAHHSHVCK